MTEHVMTEMRDDEEVIAAIVAAATSRMVRP
jgi:Tfp pilus assembly pilus retraction ATPase PilT